MSIFKFVKYSSLIYLLGRHRSKLFRSVAVLLFAFMTSLLYEDIRHYLELQHPGTLLYALSAKIIIVYGSLVFVLWQFRPRSSGSEEKVMDSAAETPAKKQAPKDRLDAFTDIDTHDRLRSRYDRVLDNHRPVDRTAKTGASENGEKPSP